MDTDGLVIGLVRELAKAEVVTPVAQDGTDLVGVHLSFAGKELDGLLKTWRDDGDRLHLVASWKPS